ncbi:hypothetical protein [Flavobacterium aquidurense]
MVKKAKTTYAYDSFSITISHNKTHTSFSYFDAPSIEVLEGLLF